MTKLNNPANCEKYPLCEHLQEKVGEIPAGFLMAALQMESKSLCGECPYYQTKNESPT
jgi:hypothetical protein